MSDWTFLTLFLLGFLGGTHCVGMCGGLSTAFALQLPPHLNRFSLIVLLNLGRLTGYIIVGLVIGLLSQTLIGLDHSRTLQLILFVLANILLLLMGLYLAGLGSAASKIEYLGKWIWKQCQPALQSLLPIQSARACFLVGILWGWFPCGLVYNAALYALGSGSILNSGLMMLAFGLGTLPNLLAMGLFATRLQNMIQNRSIRFITGLFIAAWAVVQLWQMRGLLY